jgi:Fe-S cluster assembly protein SufD
MSKTLHQQAPSAIEPYLAAFREQESDLCGGERPAIARLRRAAIALFGEIGFPNERNEDWKFTNVARFTRTTFFWPTEDSAQAQDAFQANLIHGQKTGATLACINANTPFLLKGSQALPPGVQLLELSRALEVCPELVEAHLGQHADYRQAPFVALNTAFWRDGVFLYVPPGVVVEQPITLMNLVSSYNEEGAYLWPRRTLLVLGRESQATVVEENSGLPATYATLGVTEIVLGEGAKLDHYKVQCESEKAFHIACTQAVLARDSRFSTHYIGLGGSLVRNEVRAVFTGENAEATVNGLYMAKDGQHADNFTVIDHARAHCASHELYKGVLEGKSKGVFNGKIFVRPQAQKTDAKQTNQTLLLSDDATINTKPQLEIYADDVKCTHGATVGQLDDEQLFYLRARGIGLEQARALLTFAFANDIIGRIKVASLREQLEGALLTSSHLPRLADIEDE